MPAAVSNPAHVGSTPSKAPCAHGNHSLQSRTSRSCPSRIDDRIIAALACRPSSPKPFPSCATNVGSGMRTTALSERFAALASAGALPNPAQR